MSRTATSGELFLAPIKGAEWVIHSDLRLGRVVVNERTDKFAINGMRIDHGERSYDHARHTVLSPSGYP